MPTGEIRRIETPGATGRPSVRFLDTTAPGAYVVREYEQTDEIARHVTIARAIPAGREASLADLRPRAAVLALASVGPGAEPGPLVAGPGETTERDEWWQWAGIVALILVAAEWWWFNVGGARRARVALADATITARTPPSAGSDAPRPASGGADAPFREPSGARVAPSDAQASATEIGRAHV